MANAIHQTFVDRSSVRVLTNTQIDERYSMHVISLLCDANAVDKYHYPCTHIASPSKSRKGFAWFTVGRWHYTAQHREAGPGDYTLGNGSIRPSAATFVWALTAEPKICD